MASFGKHPHVKQNSKLAKYAEYANFAYLSKNAQQVQKRQGASTFQKVRTKKPSAKTHNKYKNAKGFWPYKWFETKNLRQKKRLESIERRMPERGETFFSFRTLGILHSTNQRDNAAQVRGETFFKEQICAHCLLWQQLVTRTNHDHLSTNAPKAQTQNLRNRDSNEPSARKGGDILLKFLALNSSGPNTTNEAKRTQEVF